MSVNKTVLRKVLDLGILAFRRPSQGLYCSFCCWITGHGLAGWQAGRKPRKAGRLAGRQAGRLAGRLAVHVGWGGAQGDLPGQT